MMLEDKNIGNCSSTNICPVFANSETSSIGKKEPPETYLYHTVDELRNKVTELDNKLELLEQKEKSNERIIDSVSKTNKVTRVIIWVLLMIPIVQVFACAAVIAQLGASDMLSPTLNYIMNIVVGASILEIIAMAFKLFKSESK